MDREIKDRLNAALLAEASRRYGAKPDSARRLGEFDSFIYEYESGGEARILRLSHSSRRSAALVMGELDWIRYLVDGGVSACDVVPSEADNLLETIDDGHGGEFIVAAFERAMGDSLVARDWDEATTERFGELLGRIHALSAGYEPPNEAWRRPDWDHPTLLDVEEVLTERDQPILGVFRHLLAELEEFPRAGDGYGLIHQDAHADNLKIDPSRGIFLYDFYDCAYSWYMNELAISLFYATMWEKDPVSFSERFMRRLLTGYRREFEYDAAALGQVRTFLKLREIDLYAVILREYGDNWSTNAWNAGFMTGRRARILADMPYVAYDFRRLAANP